jgi:hypothetical protein
MFLAGLSNPTAGQKARSVYSFWIVEILFLNSKGQLMSGWQFCGAESVLENLAVNKLIEGRNGRR